MHDFLFGIYPYIALAVLLIGSVARYERDPFTWKTSSSQLLRRRQLMIGSTLFHVGVLVIFFGHLVGLLTPIALFDALGISHGAKQLLAVIAGGVAGIMALVGGAMLLHRRWMDPRIRKTSSFADIAILVLLLAQLILGLGTIFISLQHLDGHEMTKFMTWAQMIFTFRSGAADQIADVALLFKMHLFLGLTIFLVFPFTRLAHVLSGFFAPLRYLFLRPGYQLVRSRRRRPLDERRAAFDRRQAVAGPKAGGK
ncbi:respiratory nitrate reductase subunit gamma [Rhodobacter sp. HX-7-19]|uniref:nitrate reductase (quinone) n=1 Tax=Paragemmobacter kunshanensis TaxID=2583234 RepID=A0A6M1TXS5_9RHOB|nr:respiratory nitrate reductase subunit gamma [Rhodobacter kunshanensis]NGQ92417.1 respiratory nitrate reductase subunit gamma [Rhodobacter kunshanensis]